MVDVRSPLPLRRPRGILQNKTSTMIFQRTATTPFNSVSQPKGAVHYFPWPFAQFYLQPSLPWVNWRCLRTSHAVWLKLAGADVKDAQGQMRHSRASTTLDKPGPPNHLKGYSVFPLRGRHLRRNRVAAAPGRSRAIAISLPYHFPYSALASHPAELAR